MFTVWILKTHLGIWTVLRNVAPERGLVNFFPSIILLPYYYSVKGKVLLGLRTFIFLNWLLMISDGGLSFFFFLLNILVFTTSTLDLHYFRSPCSSLFWFVLHWDYWKSDCRMRPESCSASDSKACREKMRRDRLNERHALSISLFLSLCASRVLYMCAVHGCQ